MKFRMFDWLAYTVVLSLVIALIAPHQLGVTVYKLSLVSLAAVVGFYIDRSLFPYARPNEVAVDQQSSAAMRRAIIVAACMIGVSLGA